MFFKSQALFFIRTSKRLSGILFNLLYGFWKRILLNPGMVYLLDSETCSHDFGIYLFNSGNWFCFRNGFSSKLLLFSRIIKMLSFHQSWHVSSYFIWSLKLNDLFFYSNCFPVLSFYVSELSLPSGGLLSLIHYSYLWPHHFCTI